MMIHSSDKLEQERDSWRALLWNFVESTSLRIITIFMILIDLILTCLELSSSLLSCTKRKNTTAEEWYHLVGLAILSLLCLKSLALIIGLGKSFFRWPGYVLDVAVVIVALFLEAFLERRGGGLVVVVSLWRVVRVVEGAFELSDEAIEAQIQQIVCQFETLKDENARLLQIIVEKDMKIERLEEELGFCRPGR
jgi:voltage-gated hydrogen channel 1